MYVVCNVYIHICMSVGLSSGASPKGRAGGPFQSMWDISYRRVRATVNSLDPDRSCYNKIIVYWGLLQPKILTVDHILA